MITSTYRLTSQFNFKTSSSPVQFANVDVLLNVEVQRCIWISWVWLFFTIWVWYLSIIPFTIISTHTIIPFTEAMVAWYNTLYQALRSSFTEALSGGGFVESRMAEIPSEEVPSEWTLLFTQLSSFLISCDRQFGLANEHFTEYAIERFSICSRSLQALISVIEPLPELRSIYSDLNLLLESI